MEKKHSTNLDNDSTSTWYYFTPRYFSMSWFDQCMFHNNDNHNNNLIIKIFKSKIPCTKIVSKIYCPPKYVSVNLAWRAVRIAGYATFPVEGRGPRCASSSAWCVTTVGWSICFFILGSVKTSSTRSTTMTTINLSAHVVIIR